MLGFRLISILSVALLILMKLRLRRLMVRRRSVLVMICLRVRILTLLHRTRHVMLKMLCREIRRLFWVMRVGLWRWLKLAGSVVLLLLVLLLILRALMLL